MPNCIKIETTDTVLKGRTRNTAQFPFFRKSVNKYVNMSLSRFSHDWLKRSSTNEAHNIYRSALLTHFWVSKIWRAASMTSRPRASDFVARPRCSRFVRGRLVARDVATGMGVCTSLARVNRNFSIGHIRWRDKGGDFYRQIIANVSMIDILK